MWNNGEKNICKLFHILEKFMLTTSERELCCMYELPHELPYNLRLDGQVLSRPPKRQISTAVLQNCKKNNKKTA